MTIFLIMTGAMYFILPILSTPILFWGIYKDKRNYIWYMIGIILNLALVGYYYIPRFTNDLYRHFLSLDILGSMSVSEAVFNGSLLVQNLWFYLVAISDNYSLLPFSSVIITFYFTLKPLLEFGINEEISQKKLISFLFIILAWMHLIWPISGVRNSASMALFFYGVYKEFIIKDDRKRTFIYYGLSALIHHTGFILIFLRILINIFKKTNTIFMWIILSWGIFVDTFVRILNNINIPYINQIENKAISYTAYEQFSNLGLLNISIKIFLCIIYIYSYYKLKKTDKEVFYKYEYFYKVGLILALFCLGAFNNFLMIDRFGYLVLSFIPFVMMPIVKKKNVVINSLYVIYYIPFIILGLYIQFLQFRYAAFDIDILGILSKDILRLIMKN